MNADQLLAHYDQVTDQKEAGSRLRNFIVDLAVRGKLVPQDQTDEPAWELLRRIARAKARLVKAGNIRRQRSDESSRPGGLSYGLPPGWAAADFADVIVELRTGPFGSSLHQADYAVGGTPVINPASMQDGKIIPVKKMAVAKDTLDRLARFKLEVGDIVMARRGEMGRCAVVTEQENGWLCGTGSLIIRVHEYINPWYLAMLMGSPLVRDYLNGSAVGATMMNLNQSILFTMRIGVPPLAEQYRIVAKIDELMGLCDRLEGARAERECVRDRFAIASLVRLRAPERDLSVFRAHAAFAIDNVDRFTTRADQIQGLRLAVLNLAVCGKLVLRDPNDEPAWVLLRCIAEEKKRLRGAGEIRNRGLLPARSPETVPFALPAGWTWTQIAEIGVLSPRNKAPDDAQASFVPMSMIRSGYGASHHHEIRRWGTIKSGYSHFAEGDVGLAKITPCFENGKSTVFRNLTGGMGSGTTELHIFRPLFVDPAFILLFFKSPHFIDSGIPKMTGTAGQKRVPVEYLAHSPFPLPPLAEQRRIVDRVDGLMALCDRLEENLTKAEDVRRRVLDALLREALAPAEPNEDHR